MSSYDDEEARFTGRCDGTKKCKCRKCCGDRVVVSLQKDIFSYEKRCLKWCRPGVTVAGTVEVLDTDIAPGERHIVASDLIDVSCTNSTVHAEINAEYQADLRCAAHRITRDILVIDTSVLNTGSWRQDTEQMLCDGTAEVTIDAEAQITAATDLQDTTINAEFIDIDTQINEGAIPLVVSNDPTLPSTVTVDVDVMVNITP